MRPPIALLLAVACLPASDDGPPPDLNAKVVQFARDRKGEQVGNGQCTELPRAALKAAGARRVRKGDAGELLWGDPVAKPRDVRPGDIVQFEGAVFRGRKRVRLSDGRTTVVTSTQTFPHHTAVGAEVGPGGRTIGMLHQNNGGDLTVQAATLVMGDLRKGGSVRFYRPAPEADDDGRPGGDRPEGAGDGSGPLATARREG